MSERSSKNYPIWFNWKALRENQGVKPIHSAKSARFEISASFFRWARKGYLDMAASIKIGQRLEGKIGSYIVSAQLTKDIWTATWDYTSPISIFTKLISSKEAALTLEELLLKQLPGGDLKTSRRYWSISSIGRTFASYSTRPQILHHLSCNIWMIICYMHQVCKLWRIWIWDS